MEGAGRVGAEGAGGWVHGWRGDEVAQAVGVNLLRC